MFRESAAPRLEKSYREATDGMLVSSMTGPCCYAAATRHTVIVRDVAADPKWVSRSIIESHHGRLWAEPNDASPGASFSFSIPTNT